MEIFCIYLQSMINTIVEWKLAATLHKDTSQLIVYNLMWRLFKNITEELKISLFVHAISKLKFPCHFGNTILKQFTL